MASRRAIVVLLAALVGCNALSGAADLVADRDDDADASAPEGGAPSPPPPIDAGAEAQPGDDATDASDDFLPFDGADANSALIVFVTSSTSTASFGGVSGGDAICQMHATAGGLSGTFVAWLSTQSVSALSRVTSAGPWFTRDGKLAVSRASIATGSGIESPIQFDESGNKQGDEAWTGTKSDGTIAPGTCTDWTTTVAFSGGVVGNVTGNGGGWSDHRTVSCASTKHLFCFQN